MKYILLTKCINIGRVLNYYKVWKIYFRKQQHLQIITYFLKNNYTVHILSVKFLRPYKHVLKQVSCYVNTNNIYGKSSFTTHNGH